VSRGVPLRHPLSAVAGGPAVSPPMACASRRTCASRLASSFKTSGSVYSFQGTAGIPAVFFCKPAVSSRAPPALSPATSPERLAHGSHVHANHRLHSHWGARGTLLQTETELAHSAHWNSAAHHLPKRDVVAFSAAQRCPAANSRCSVLAAAKQMAQQRNGAVCSLDESG